MMMFPERAHIHPGEVLQEDVPGPVPKMYESGTPTFGWTGREDTDPLESSKINLTNILEQLGNISQIKSMNRAFPAVKLYVIEENKNQFASFEQREFIQSHYHDITDWLINARVIKQKDNPADYLILTLDDSDGFLTGRAAWTGQQFGDDSFSIDQARTPTNLGAAGGFIRDGISIELRVGYDANPNSLAIEMSGFVSSVHGSDVLTVEVMGYGAELVMGNAVRADGENRVINNGLWPNGATSSNIVNALFLGESGGLYFKTEQLDSFGQGRLPHLGKFWVREGPILDLSSPSAEGVAETRKIHEDRTVENLWIPRISEDILRDNGTQWLSFPVLSGVWNPFADANQIDFNAYMMSLWDILKHLELRHPGFVASVVPYPSVHGTEATIFFGRPEFPYLAFGQNHHQFASSRIDVLTNHHLVGAKVGDTSTSSVIEKASVGDANINKRIRPFKNYYIVTAEQDIIENQLRTNREGAYNGVRLYFKEGKTEKDAAGRLPSDSNTSMVEVKANENLLGADIRWLEIEEPNAFNPMMAKTIAVGYLLRSLRNLYQGHITTIGIPGLKPYDSLIIIDRYSNIHGVVDVAEVEQLVDPQMGFISRIKPMMVAVTENNVDTLLVNMTIMGMFGQETLGVLDRIDTFRPAAANSIGSTLAWFEKYAVGTQEFLEPGLLGAIFSGGWSLILACASWGTKLFLGRHGFRSPIILAPLNKNGQPFMDGMHGYSRPLDGMWETTIKGMEKQRTLFDENMRQTP